MRRFILLLLLMLVGVGAEAQYTRQDTLRGSNGRGRDWWDVYMYELDVEIDTATKSIAGKSSIYFTITGEPNDSLQIDLQEPLTIDSVKLEVLYSDISQMLPVKRPTQEGNVWWLKYPFPPKSKEVHAYGLYIFYHGKPRQAINPPWDGGFIWTQDSTGNPWIAVACQGLGASSWWPCKDYQGDEPDRGMNISILHPVGNLFFISNGINKWTDDTDLIGYVVNKPINTYNITFYIGDYAHYHDTLYGEKGVLDLDFYPLKYNESKARKQWAVTKSMLHCFEYWMGPYPFYEDGYKLVEAPYLGMEHQSAIAYGNNYENGYNGRGLHKDRSGTGVGFSFDFIIIHESGHEWFGNNITAQDIADNWLHEGFTTYTECLFAEWIKGKDSAFAYTMGEWKNIKNDRPLIGDYGVNNEGSGDIYDKGSAVVHMIRMMLNDDGKFRQLLRGLNKDFYHKIVTTGQVEEYISKYLGRDLKPFFDTYLRTVNKPGLQWYVGKGVLHYRWVNVRPGFMAPVQLITGKQTRYLTIGTKEAPVPVSGAGVTIKPAGWYDVEERKF